MFVFIDPFIRKEQKLQDDVDYLPDLVHLVECLIKCDGYYVAHIRPIQNLRVIKMNEQSNYDWIYNPILTKEIIFKKLYLKLIIL